MYTVVAHHSAKNPKALISVKRMEPSTARSMIQIADAAESGIIRLNSAPP
jgi:hypothetical protein